MNDQLQGNDLQYNELRSYRHLLYASAIGLTTGMSATLFYSLGAFMPSLQAEFGWSRGDISLAATFMTLAIFLAGTSAGKLCDRYGAALVGAGSLVSYALGVIVMVALVKSLSAFWLAYFLTAIVGVGSTPIVMVRPLTTTFVQARGIALGIALTGAGIAGFWVPRLVTAVTQAYGWREAYLALAAVALIAAPFVWFGFRNPPQVLARAAERPVLDGMPASAARKTKTYWVLSAMAFAMACGIAGVVVHLVPLFIDHGATPVTAAAVASMVGITSVIGRLVVGYALDRLPTVSVCIAVLLSAALGIFLLWAFGFRYAYPATLLLGLATGAEIDLLAYLTVTFFGQRYYGAIYGWQYSVFALGYGLSPYAIGQLREFFHGYQVALLASAALLAFAALLSLLLPGKRQLAFVH